MSDYSNRFVAYMSCLERGQQFKAEGCQSTIAMHPWYSGVLTFPFPCIMEKAFSLMVACLVILYGLTCLG